jgi:hypothetical protein
MSVLDDVLMNIESGGRSLFGLLLKEVDGFKHYLAVDLNALGSGGVSHIVVPPTAAETAAVAAAAAPASQATLDELVAAVMAKLTGQPAPVPAAGTSSGPVNTSPVPSLIPPMPTPVTPFPLAPLPGPLQAPAVTHEDVTPVFQATREELLAALAALPTAIPPVPPITPPPAVTPPSSTP